MAKKRNLVEQTALEILSRIGSSRQFQPGCQLPNENTLSVELGVSRTTLREAIRILTAQGVLTVRRGHGTFVCDEKSLPELSIGMPEFILTQIKDLHEARLLFEPGAAAIACVRASDEQIAQILHYGQLTEQAIQGGRDRTEEDKNFHRAIITAAGNNFLIELWPIVEQAIEKTIKINQQDPLLSEYTSRDHALLMSFLEARDALGAKAAMQLHIVRAITGLGKKPPMYY